MEDLDATLGRVNKKTKAQQKVEKGKRAHAAGTRTRDDADDGERKERARPAGARPRPPPKPSKKSGISYKHLGFLLLIVGGGLRVILPLLESGMDFVSGGSVQPLSVNVTAHMQDLFFSGAPWLVYCSNSTENIPRVISSAAHHATLGNKGEKFSVGVLDCDAKLPSGQTVLERFKLVPANAAAAKPASETNTKAGKRASKDKDKEKEAPKPNASAPNQSMVFYVANGEKPAVVPMGYFQDEKRATALVEFIRSRIELKFVKVSNSYNLRSGCLQKRGCVLLLNPGSKLPDETMQILYHVMRGHRMLTYAVADSSKVHLSIENQLPPPSEDGWPRVVYFRPHKKPAAPSPVEAGAEAEPAAADAGSESEQPAEASADAPADADSGEPRAEAESDDSGGSQSSPSRTKPKRARKAKPAAKPKKKDGDSLSVMAKAFRGDFISDAIVDWLTGVKEEMLTPLKRVPTLSVRTSTRSSSSSKKDKVKESAAKPKDAADAKPAKERPAASKSKLPAEPSPASQQQQPQPTDQDQEQQTRERLRREAMDRETEAHTPQAASDEDERAPDEEDVIEEEAVDLDDAGAAPDDEL